jgi:ribosomal protein S18 acetylase RimI-like enzyme
VNAALVGRIEAAGRRAWPAFETEEYDGWLLRYAGGFSRRGNSAYPLRPSTIGYQAKLGRCREWFATRGVDFIVRQTPETEPGLDLVLAARGFVAEGRTDVMVGDLPLDAAAAVEPTSTPTQVWWDAAARLWGIAGERVASWRRIIDLIEPATGFAVMEQEGEAIAVGFAVADGSLLGLFEIVVAGEWRHRGFGRRLTSSLLAWGRARGAATAYLQVVAGNAPAVALYRSLGFERAYTYWYRRSPF